MNLLEQWQKKKSWQNQFIRGYYYTNDKGDVDMDLAAMIKKEKKPILDMESDTGFKGIEYLAPEQNYEYEQKKYDVETMTKLTNLLIKALKKYIRTCWDPKIFHLIFCSGGTDSRILSNILRELREDGFDLGELLFLCHKDEIPLFKKAMKEQKWDEVQYKGFRENQIYDVDYYDWGVFSYNMNAYAAPRLDFYTDILKKRGLTTKDVCLMTGVINDTLFMYPSAVGKSSKREHWGYKELNLEIFENYTQFYRPYYFNGYYNWKDILYPYINQQYLDICFQIPSKFFVREPGLNDRNNFTIDIIRSNILKKLGNKTPIVCEKHKYNFSFSLRKRLKITKNWLESKLFEDFPEVRGYSPGIAMPQQEIRSTDLYGLATCYEVAKQ